MTGRRGRKRRKLLDDLKERRGYSHLKEEALDHTMWRAQLGRGFGPVVRQTTKRNVRYYIIKVLKFGRISWAGYVAHKNFNSVARRNK